VFKLCTKVEWNQAVCPWVIDDLAHFCLSLLRADTYLWIVLRSVGVKVYQICGEHRAIIDAHQICFRCHTSCSSWKCGWFRGDLCQKLWPNFTLFCACKNSGRGRQDVWVKNQSLVTTKPPVCVWWVASLLPLWAVVEHTIQSKA